MSINYANIEALVALIAVVAFLISVGKWIQMREAIANRVIEVDNILKDIDKWRQECPSKFDAVYMRKESCNLHMSGINEKYERLEELLHEIKKSLEESHGRRR